MAKNYWQNFRLQKQNDIIIASKELFAVSSIEEVSMEKIAERAGIGVASLYRYYGTKVAVAAAVGVYYWQQIAKDIAPIFDSQEYKQKTGIERLKCLLDVYTGFYVSRPDFLHFLDDFDNFCLKSNVSREDLADYQNSITDFYKFYRDGIDKGLKDGSVKTPDSDGLLYLTMNHAMLSTLRKMARGEILEQDNRYLEELELLKIMFLNFFTNVN